MSNPAIASAPAGPAVDDIASDNEQPNKEFLSDEEGDDGVEEDEAEIKPWDEGGQSHCGYSDTVHETLMSVGAKVHSVVGTPGKEISQVQQSIGNWFQELSYAARDIVRGENTADMHQDAADAVKTLMSGGKTEEDEEQSPEQDEEKKDNEEAESSKTPIDP